MGTYSKTESEAARAEHKFGCSTPLTIGVEEELLLVDEGCGLVAEGEQVMKAIDAAHSKSVSTEIFATQIEMKTGVCENAEQAMRELREVRRALAAVGARLMGSGLYPADSGEPALVEKARYEPVKKDLVSLLATPPCGLHVHVGVPDPETAVAVANAMRQHLPLLAALAANSPFRDGADTGLASARAAAVRSYPRFEMPRAFRDYEDFLRVADQLITAAGAPDYTYLWWDVRPHPNLGTVEVRGMDIQPRPEQNVAIAALIQALAAKEMDRPKPPNLTREAIEESYFQAERYGLEARLMVDEQTAATARELARAVLEEVRPYAADLKGEGALEEIERILVDGNGADRQRRVHGEGGIEALLEDLVERTRA
ncbi:MAG TPA: YbdK family carboxylate-amine ligase [Solirubrobacterales bacterium]|nr:YbdK family carboxylate-amine ligase [Solirubrobacterales bacterium]